MKIKPVGSAPKLPQLNPTVQERMRKQAQYKSMDTGHVGAVATKSIMDPLQWRDESPETVDAIKHKATCLAPAYSKGAYQYVSAGTNPHDLGRKR